MELEYIRVRTENKQKKDQKKDLRKNYIDSCQSPTNMEPISLPITNI